MADRTRVHPVTGAILRRGVRSQTLHYAIYNETIDVPGWYPEDDGDAVHVGADLDAIDAAFLVIRARYAARIKALRKQLGLTQEAAGRILGGGKRAFQKYESGTVPPSDAAVAAIELLGRDPAALQFLQNLPGRQLAA